MQSFLRRDRHGRVRERTHHNVSTRLHFYVGSPRTSLPESNSGIRDNGEDMRSNVSFVCVFLLVAAAAGFAQSDTKTNYSGAWRMMKEKSDFGKFTAPDSLVRTVDQKDVTINVHTAQTGPAGKASADVTYYTDGRESINEVRGRESKSHCFWDGSVLVIRTYAKASNNTPIETEERWELSSDGKILTMTSHMETGLTQHNFKLVCERVPK